MYLFPHGFIRFYTDRSSGVAVLDYWGTRQFFKFTIHSLSRIPSASLGHYPKPINSFLLNITNQKASRQRHQKRNLVAMTTWVVLAQAVTYLIRPEENLLWVFLKLNMKSRTGSESWLSDYFEIFITIGNLEEMSRSGSLQTWKPLFRVYKHLSHWPTKPIKQ